MSDKKKPELTREDKIFRFMEKMKKKIDENEQNSMSVKEIVSRTREVIKAFNENK